MCFWDFLRSTKSSEYCCKTCRWADFYFIRREDQESSLTPFLLSVSPTQSSGGFALICDSTTNTAPIADAAKANHSTSQADEDVVRSLPPHAAPTPRSSGAHISNPNADVEANQASLEQEQESTVAAASTVGTATGALVASGAAAVSTTATTGPTPTAGSTGTSAGPTATNASVASVTAAPSTNAQEPWKWVVSSLWICLRLVDEQCWRWLCWLLLCLLHVSRDVV